VPHVSGGVVRATILDPQSQRHWVRRRSRSCTAYVDADVVDLGVKIKNGATSEAECKR